MTLVPGSRHVPWMGTWESNVGPRGVGGHTGLRSRLAGSSQEHGVSLPSLRLLAHSWVPHLPHVAILVCELWRRFVAMFVSL